MTMTTLASKVRTDAAAKLDQDEFLRRTIAFRSLIEEETAKEENAGRTPLPVVEAAREAGIFWMQVPTSLGGSDTQLVPFLKTTEELASADSSVGWTIGSQCIATMVGASYASDEHAARVFGGKRLPIMSATYAPTGKAVYADGFYTGSGRYSWGTGIAHADWVSSALVLFENGQPVLQADGRPRVVGAVVPRNTLTLHGNWNVCGMQATGSFDYELPEQKIAESWTFNQYWTEPKRQSLAATVGTLVVVCAGHLGMTLGIARRSLHEAARAATAKKRLYATAALSETPTFKLEFARHEALYQAARARCLDLLRAADEKAATGQGLDESEMQTLRQATTWTHQVCRDIGLYAYGSVSSSVRLPSILARNVMDAAVASQHYIVNDMSIVDAAPFIIDRWADSSAKHPD